MKKIFIIATLGLLFLGCSPKNTDVSSYKNASMKHQQDRAKEAHKELN